MLSTMASSPGNAFLLSSLFVVFLNITYARLVEKVPFILLAPRSYAIFNRRESLWLYPSSENGLPSKQQPPLESLTGKRLGSAFFVEICFLAIVVLSALRIHIDPRVVSNQANELAFSCVILFLWTFRFLPTAYRRPLNFNCMLLNSCYLSVKLCRDVLPLFLTRPSNVIKTYSDITTTQASLSAIILAAHYATPRVWYPVDPFAMDAKGPSPEQVASPWSMTGTYSWLSYLIWARRRLEMHDLPELPDVDATSFLSRKLGPHRDDFRLFNMFWMLRDNLLLCLGTDFLTAVSCFISPLSLRLLLTALEAKTSKYSPWLYMFGLAIKPALDQILKDTALFFSSRFWSQLQAATVQALFAKTLRIHNSNPTNTTETSDDSEKSNTKPGECLSRNGRIYNLVSSDLGNYDEARGTFQIFSTAIPRIVLGLILLHQLVGWPAFVGAVLSGLSCFVLERINRATLSVQHESRQAADDRISQTSELLTSIRMVKYHGWEKLFFENICARRVKEVRLIFRRNLYTACIEVTTAIVPRASILIMLFLFTKVKHEKLSVSVAFTLVTLFDIIRDSFKRFATESARLPDFLVSHGRIKSYLQNEDEVDEKVSFDHQGGKIECQDATFTWAKSDDVFDNHNFRLHDVNLSIEPGGLTIITGAIASGKTSLLMALLGEMRILQGKVSLPRKDGVSLVPQKSWLLNASVRQNILFGLPYDQPRYNKVLDACSLRADLEAFEAGDMTDIGERGLTLSGGQQQRVSLARAVYARAKIVLIDDVFSALDTSTARDIFENCIRGELLRDRTVVLVTHHVSLVRASATQMIHLSHGTISPEDQKAKVDSLELDSDAASLPGTKEELVELLELENIPTEGKLVLGEERAIGRLSPRLIYNYLRFMGGPFIILCLFTVGFMDSVVTVGENIILGLWVDSPKVSDMPNDDYWLRIYATSLGLIFLVEAAWIFGFAVMQQLASQRIHDAMLKSILHAPLRFFDTNPTGRLINRFSNDLEAIDRALPFRSRLTFGYACDLLLKSAAIVGLIPSFLVSLVVSAAIATYYGLNYLRAQIEVRRLASISASPMITTFGEAIQGVVVIRAFGLQEFFLQRSMRLIDDWIRALKAVYNLQRWISTRLAFCGSLVGTTAGYLAITTKVLSLGLIGFSVGLTLRYSDNILDLLREYGFFEVGMTSFERAQEYINCEQEQDTPDSVVPASWPLAGDIHFENLSVRYFRGGPQVLNNINFAVKSGERIGIVGRSGVGKSTIATSILRFTDIFRGRILINGRDIATIPLQALRQRITFIPQDPTCFRGTVRYNLDPFGVVDDSELESALQASGLANLRVQARTAESTSSTLVSESQSPVDDGKGSRASGVLQDFTANVVTRRLITLDTMISHGGENLSQGQRQLLAFARALIRRSKLVILDEATSSTDHDTDIRIQETIRTSFADSSLITIAHRLHTVMSFDRILVLENHGTGGEVLEYNTPLNLLQDSKSRLHKLAKDSGDFEALIKVARDTAG